MSKISWSPAQEKAIETIGTNILVSAGAGSGKTAVLTERIYQLVKKGTDLSKFLVLTFTKAASMEMKNRIRKKLLEDPECSHLASEIENAHIETFDAFSLFLVKKYAYHFGISSDISIVDTTLIKIKQQKIRDEIFTEYYQKDDPAFNDLILIFSRKNDNDLKELCLRISALSDLQIDKYGFLNTFIDTYFNKNKIEEFIKEKYQSNIEAISRIISLAESLEDSDDATNIIDTLSPLLINKDYDSLYDALKATTFPRKPTKKGVVFNDGDYRENIKKYYDKLRGSKSDNDFGHSEDIIELYLNNKKYAEVLINIVIDIEHRLDAFKKEHNCYSFGDVARMAISLLRDKDIKEDMKGYFSYILVDEYQDTSDIQEEVVNALGENNIYMVGDVKQSIYRFRNANCNIFQEKYINYKHGNGGIEIDLNTSFRSREEVVNLINEMFLVLMDKKNNPIDYKDGHNFIYGRKEYKNFIDDKNDDYKMKIYRYQYQKVDECADKEAEMVALDIINKYNKHLQVFDDSTKEHKLRDCRFLDFAIIIDRSAWFDNFKAIFTKYNIPLHIYSDEAVRDSDLALTIKNLVKLHYFISINDMESTEFIHSYVSVSRSFLINQNDEEIYKTIKNKTFRYSPIIDQLIMMEDELNNSSLYETLLTIFERLKIYDYIPTIGDISSNNHKLEIFLNLAKSMDQLSYTLEDMVTYFDDLSSYQLDVSFSDNDNVEDAVKIMTIHHSKGLEFPICYFPGLAKQFVRDDKTSFVISKKYGLILPITGVSSYSSLGLSLSKQDEVLEDYYEKLRLLYVALTRAKERIILLIGDKEKESISLDPKTVKSFNKMLKTTSFVDKYSVPFNPVIQSINKVANEIKPLNIKMGHIEIKPTIIEQKKASKEVEGDIDKGLLEFGTQIHYLLEITNYENKDTSFIKDYRLRKYVNNVVNNPLFDKVKNSEIRHEFSFFDEKNNVHGVIDCLLIKDDHIDIIDFKLKKIDDDKYDKQLRTYRDYIATISDLPIRMYLLSAITGEVREVE